MRQLSLAAISVASMSATVVANPMPFEIFENEDAVITDGILISVDAFDAGGAIDFLITNNSISPGIVTEVLIERTATSSQLGASDLLGAPWETATSRTPPGSLSNQYEPWQDTLFSFRSEPPRVHNGLDSGDSLTIRFDLGSLSFADAYTAFANGEFRFVTHIQSIGESSIWGVNVPAPATLGAIGAAGLFGNRRKR